MDEVVEFLEQNKVGFLATTDEQGNPHVRVVGMACIKDKHIYYATATNKAMYAQMQANPMVELAVSTADYSMNLRVAGEAVIDDTMELKKEIMAAAPSLQSIYGTAENPIFTLFYIIPKTARFWSYTQDRTIELS